MNFPTEKEIQKLHKKYSKTETMYELVYTHCQVVRDIALELAKNVKQVDINLIIVGSLIHDIGVYTLFDDNDQLIKGRAYIEHGVSGEKILMSEGFDQYICNFCSHHTGVGLSVNDVKRQNLPLPIKDYLAETTEEELVMYADKFHSKVDPPKFNSFEWYKKDISRFGKDKSEKFQIMADKFSLPDLKNISKLYRYEIR